MLNFFSLALNRYCLIINKGFPGLFTEYSSSGNVTLNSAVDKYHWFLESTKVRSLCFIGPVCNYWSRGQILLPPGQVKHPVE